MKTIKISAILAVILLIPPAALFAQAAPAKNAPDKVPATAEAPAPAARPQAAVTPAPGAGEPVKDPFEAAQEKLKSQDPVLRRQGVKFLAQSRDPRAVPGLLGALGDASAPVRQSAIEGLGLLSWREASPKISALLTKDPDAGVRQQSAISLSYLQDPEAGPALIKALSDVSPAVRYAAMRTLGTMRYAPADGAIAAMLEGTDTNMLRSAISALGMIQSTTALSAITSALAHPEQPVRVEAARALGDIGDKSAALELKNHLAGAEDAAMRVESALALAKMGFKEGLPTAREFLASPDLSLKNQALNIIVAAGDVESLPVIEEMYAAEADPVVKQMLDFARQRLGDLKATQKKK